MLEKYPPEVNDDGWPAVVATLAERNGFALAEVDLFVFTQVRKRTIEKVMNALEQPLAKAHTMMEKWGYTGSACIPMALHDAIDQRNARSRASSWCWSARASATTRPASRCASPTRWLTSRSS